MTPQQIQSAKQKILLARKELADFMFVQKWGRASTYWYKYGYETYPEAIKAKARLQANIDKAIKVWAGLT